VNAQMIMFDVHHHYIHKNEHTNDHVTGSAPLKSMIIMKKCAGATRSY